MRILAFPAALILACFPARAEVSFLHSTPEAEGFNRTRLNALKDRLASHRTRALLIVRHDKIVYEWYAAGAGPSQTQGTASMAKALVGGMSLLAALNDARLAVDDLACRYIPAWK